MTQTIRLLRYGLLARVGLTLVEAVLSAQVSDSGPWLRLTADFPYVISLVLVLLSEWRGWHSVRALSIMMVVVMCNYAAEVIALAVLAMATGPATAAHVFAALALDRLYHLGDVSLLYGSYGASAYSTIQIMVSIFPPLLGTWLGGPRSALRWAGLAAGVDLAGRLAATVALGSPLPPRAQVFDFLAYATVVTMICMFAGTLAERERTEQRQLRAANRLLAEQARTQQQLAASRERVRMARDLHDTLAHSLAALSVQLQTVEAALENPEPTARELLGRAATLAEEGLQNVRNAIVDLRATQVKDLGLVAALEKHIEVLAPHAGCEVVLQAGAGARAVDQSDVLTDETADALFRIAQEALNNVVRHACATRAVVSLTVSAGPPAVLTLRVQDDGQGFDVSRLDDMRFGLRGMRERAELIGARWQINSARGRGTTVQVALELPSETDSQLHNTRTETLTENDDDEDTRARGR
jgi:signal transduction histidine kinase